MPRYSIIAAPKLVSCVSDIAGGSNTVPLFVPPLSSLGPRSMSGLDSSSYGVKNILSVSRYIALSPFVERSCIKVLVRLFVLSRTDLVSILIVHQGFFLYAERFDGHQQIFVLFQIALYRSWNLLLCAEHTTACGR